jgi:hypothetical protein
MKYRIKKYKKIQKIILGQKSPIFRAINHYGVRYKGMQKLILAAGNIYP